MPGHDCQRSQVKKWVKNGTEAKMTGKKVTVTRRLRGTYSCERESGNSTRKERVTTGVSQDKEISWLEKDDGGAHGTAMNGCEFRLKHKDGRA